jgi:hypothetical protein
MLSVNARVVKLTAKRSIVAIDPRSSGQDMRTGREIDTITY